MVGLPTIGPPRLAGWIFRIGLASVILAPAAPPPADPAPLAVVKRGLTGEIRIHHPGTPLRADPDQDLSAPILVRVEPDAGRRNPQYVVRFMGALAGTYNLSDWIVGPDGRPASGLKPLIVQVISDLPAEQGTNLYEIVDPPVSIRGGYRIRGGILVLLWCLVPVVASVRRWLRPRESKEPAPPEPVPTLADQLRPLAVRAREQTLTVAEQGRLELLLVFFWRERLGRPATPIGDVLPLLRRHPEAGPLLSAVEQWLHRPGGTGWEDSSLDRLMEPYRHVPAISETELAGSAGEGSPA